MDNEPHFQDLQGKTLKELKALAKDDKGLPVFSSWIMRIPISILLPIVVFFGCSEPGSPKDMGVEINKADSVKRSKPDSSAKPPSFEVGLKVSAHLIYNDGSLSTFDVINDKTVALWNVIAAGGDAIKRSDSTKLDLNGKMDSLKLRIKDGRKLVIDTNILHIGEGVHYVIKNTGCNEVYIIIARNKKIVFNDTIPFHCGE